MTFWDELLARRKPIVGLSPMDGVSDAAMRYMSAKYGNILLPRERVSALSRENVGTRERVNGGIDILFSEFVSVDALHYASGERRERLLKTFVKARDVGELEHKPYEIAQVFGNKPDYFGEAAQLIERLGFDGVDINMGCPAHKVEEQGSGAGLIRTPAVAQAIVRAVKSATTLPVSVKTRIGVDSIVVEEWMEQLMEVEPAMISLHGRTLRQLYQGSADWEAIGRAAEVVHKLGGHLLGNGDVQSMQDGMDKVKQYGVDGFLIGRAAEGNPAVFLQRTVLCKECGLQRTDPCIHQRLTWLLEHAQIYETVFGITNFNPMRKHLAWYCKGFPGAVEVRSKLMQTNSASEVEEILRTVI